MQELNEKILQKIMKNEGNKFCLYPLLQMILGGMKLFL